MQEIYWRTYEWVRQLVLLSIEYFIVWVEGWCEQQKNVIAVAVSELGGKATLRDFILEKSCSQQTVGAAKDGHYALKMQKVFWKKMIEGSTRSLKDNKREVGSFAFIYRCTAALQFYVQGEEGM